MRPPESLRSARLTFATALLIFAAWAVVALLGLEGQAAYWGGFIPARSRLDMGGLFAPFWLTPLTAVFVHAGAFHLLFNLLIHVFCGRSVEGVLGPWGFAALYVVGAYAAAGAHWVVQPTDLTPMVGASGAISAVLGAYALLFGRNKVRVESPRLALWLNALWLLAAWVALQVIVGLTFATGGIKIAFAAHIGGFVAGLLLANPLLLLRYRTA